MGPDAVATGYVSDADGGGRRSVLEVGEDGWLEQAVEDVGEDVVLVSEALGFKPVILVAPDVVVFGRHFRDFAMVFILTELVYESERTARGFGPC